MIAAAIFTGFMFGFLFREWSSYAQKGLNWMKHRPHKKKYIAQVKKQLESMKLSGMIGDYELKGVCLTCRYPHADVQMKPERSRTDLSVVPPDGDPTPPRGA